MNAEILRFLTIIRNNNLHTESRLPEILDTPEIVDEHPKIISDLMDEIQESGVIPPSLIFFLLNGKSGRPEMEEFMEEEYSRFKVVVFANQLWRNKELKDHILEEASKAIEKLSGLKEHPHFLYNINLKEIINVKIKYCKLTQDLLQADLPGKTEPAEETKKIESEEGVYVFRLRPELSKISYEKLKTLHSNLKKKNLIDCTLPNFQKLFVKNEDGTPSSTPKPIIWKNGTYNSLSYFIKRLSEKIIIPDEGRPATGTFSNNQIVLKLFYNQKEGQFFTPKKIGHNKGPSKTVKDIIDSAL